MREGADLSRGGQFIVVYIGSACQRAGSLQFGEHGEQTQLGGLMLVQRLPALDTFGGVADGSLVGRAAGAERQLEVPR